MKSLSALLLLILFNLQSITAQTHKLLFTTSFGEFKVVLYDFTPAHRDLMLQSLKNEVYKDALFNRIIENFVVQGGEHDVDIARREAQDPQQQKPRLAPEFDDRAFHKLGALGQGRDGNPEKASFLNQIYFVVGKAVTSAELDSLEHKKGIRFTDQQRADYLNIGGQPRLDKDYTVFGEVYEGLDVLMNMSRSLTNDKNYPVEDIFFEVIELKNELSTSVSTMQRN